ncbi:hypothetical protein LUZ61_019232 [Rhynchospora tenuis]|uniref:Cytochrome P450 n=1 Tax=Rhynchospora tenuis TaxID=198213 RepID=A0AAD5ZAT8_9POAL|nr:hypothetical protein LUZ61_019232 [Rhynchospora tenuis]
MAWPSLSPPELLFSICCISLFIYYFFHYFVSSKQKQPIVPICWPVVGMMPALIFNIHDLHAWATRILHVTRCNFFFNSGWLGMNLFGTCDPLNIQHIFTSNFQNYPKGEDFSDIFDILGDGILNSDGDVWRTQRVKMQQLISHSCFRAYVAKSSQDKVEKALLPFLAHAAKQGHAIDLQDVCLRFTFDITTKLVFGVDPNGLSIGLPTIPFARAMDDAMVSLLFRHAMPVVIWKLLQKLNLGAEKKLANARKVIDRFVEETICHSSTVIANTHQPV